MERDEPRPVRAGEELDLARLRPWLARALAVDEQIALTVQQFPGGHSNLTYLVTVGDREYALRRPPFGSKVKTAHDMAREYAVLSRLAPVWPKAPRPVAFCDDESFLGARFYLMERTRGLILRKEPPPGLVLDEKTCARLCESLVDTLVELHGIDYPQLGLSDFGKPDGYVERQVAGWAKRYGDAQTDDIPSVTEVARWLAANIPASGAPTLLHNDYKFDNVILDERLQVAKILDWEMSTLGDPLMDLGTALCYWVEPGDSDVMRMFRFGPTVLPGMFSRREIAERYAARTSRDLSHVAFYYCFGLFKTAVVAQQIHYRFKKGLTTDDRFAALIYGVRALADQALAVSQTGRI
jgi:aminoglycoside phosphotransferase (APT) family kinase protein